MGQALKGEEECTRERRGKEISDRAMAYANVQNRKPCGSIQETPTTVLWVEQDEGMKHGAGKAFCDHLSKGLHIMLWSLNFTISSL